MRFTGFRDRPAEERKIRFQNGCREGHTELALTNTGINLQLMFNPNSGIYHHHQQSQHQEKELDFDKEHGKVRIHNYLLKKNLFF